jgi:hypothetical protein
MFKPIIHNSFESNDQAVCDAPRVGLLSNIVNNQIRTAFKHNYRVTDEEAANLQTMFKRQLVFMNDDENAHYKNSSHPILSVLHEYANHDASEQIRTLRRDGFSTMSIGDSINKTLNADHNCLLLNSDREAFRYVTNAANKLGIEQQTIKEAAIYKKKCNYCLDGAEKCHYKAPFCFAVHSVYDITPEDLYAIFANHGVEKMVVYCYIPIHLYDEEIGVLDQKQGHYKLWEEKDTIIFTMGDFSINYEHSYNNWKKWAMFSRLIGPEFNIIKEHSRYIGPMHILTLARTGKFGGPMSFIIPLSEMYGEYYRLPSIGHVINNLETLKQSQVYHYIVPKHVYDTLLSYAIRASDEGYKFNELATLASGLLRSIKIGPVTYQDRWNVSAHDYNDILMSIFMIGAIKRTDRTKGISQVFSHLKSWQGTFPVFYRVHQFFTSIELSLKKHFSYHVGQSKAEFDTFYDSNLLWEFDVIPITDILVRKDIEINYDDIIKRTNNKKINLHQSNIIQIQESTNTENLLHDYQRKYQDMKYKFEKENKNAWYHNLDAPNPDNIQKITFFKNLSDDESKSSDNNANKIGHNQETPATIISNHDVQIDKINHTKMSIKNHNTPASFLNGHCALKSIWESFPDHKRPKQRDMIAAVYDRMCKIITEKDEIKYNHITHEQIIAYIMAGNWTGNDCSTLAIDAACHVYDLCVHIITGVAGLPTLTMGISGSNHVNIYFENSHYTSMRGGASDKFNVLIEKMEKFYPGFDSVIELSCAPGNLLYNLGKRTKIATGLFYEPGIPMSNNLDFMPLPNVSIEKYHKHTEIGKRLENTAYDVIICDAADKYNSEKVITNILNHTPLQTGDNLVIKTFGNIDAVYNLATKFQFVDVHTTGVGNERYFFMKNYDELSSSNTYDSIYNLYGLRETTHLIPFNYVDTIAFSKQHFTGAFTKYKEYFKYDKNKFKNVGKNYTITINAITGYPSASKTTDCTAKYNKAVYVAPSKNLAIKHNKLGVASFTPHTIFEEIINHSNRYENIVIDEISQFPIEFLMMIHMVVPDLPMIVLGDVFQIPHVNYLNNKKYKTVKDFGIVNNIHTIYKVPIDITNCINNKFGYHMQTKSDVKKSMCLFTGPFEQLKRFKIITFNDLTVKELTHKGYDASTITTYAGDRQPVVVLYIDGKSVMSQLNNKPEWIYTAMTRATEKLIITGDGPYLIKYLNLNHTNIESYTDINNIKFHHDVIIEKIENDKATVEITQQKILAAPIVVHTDVATQVCMEHIKPINEATSCTMFTQPVDLPPVEKGTLRVNLDTLIHKHRSFKGHMLIPNVAFVKNQVSNDPKETTRCLIKRYSKNLPKMSEKRTLITTNILIEALAKAIYGNKDKVSTLQKDLQVSEADMLKYGIEYLESLQKKLNKTPELIKELQNEFNEYQETLTFVMKKQSKFDPQIGFDSSDKVGQGVASMSKKVNILMGAYARAILDRIRTLININKKKIILATHDSDAGLNDLYTAVRQTCANDATWLLNDFKEWDSTFRRCMTYVTKWLMEAVGCPIWLSSWFTLNRMRWNMLYFNKLGVTSLKGEEKQFSGNPFTICENTVGNLTLIYSLYDIKNEQMAMFKGDDSAIFCQDAKFTALGQLIINETGHQLKPHLTVNGEFAGYALTSCGLFPDVLRFTCKFLGKVYTDETHFNEVVQSVQERCTVVKNELQKREGAIIISNHYADIGLKAEEALLLFDFLKGSRNIHYQQLTCVDLPIASN